MELRQLKYFEAVARERHFTRAASDLRVAQSALSHQIAQLERELGTQLLHRTTRSVELTEAGELVVARVRPILAEVAAIRDDVEALRGLVRGRLAIGALVFGGELDIPAVIAEFALRHPGLDLQLREGTAGSMAALLLDGGLDLAFVLEPETRPSEFDAIPLSTEELVAVAAPDHPIAARGELRIGDLADQDLIMFDRSSSTRSRVEDRFARAGVTPRSTLEANDLALVRSLVARGLGVAILPRTFADLPGPPVAVRPLTPALHMPVALWSRAGRPLSSAARVFAEYARASAGPTARRH